MIKGIIFNSFIIDPETLKEYVALSGIVQERTNIKLLQDKID